jgi:hypothetical protein
MIISVPIQHLAIIFDDTTRPETTGVYCLRALQRLVHVEHFRPSDLERIPANDFDLFLQIDDGLQYGHPPNLRPCAWWAIDTHVNFEWCLSKARAFDFVFAAQRDGAERLRQAGIASARWLPLACDPERHGKQETEKRYDVAFVGNVFPGPRADLLDRIQRRFRNTFVGRCYFEDMARTYSAARIVFNRSVLNDINMRVFEALASGSLLLTNDLRGNGQEELFQDGVYLATYQDAEDLLDKIEFYLRCGDVRERIAAAGRAEVLARHTYQHRMQTILECGEVAPLWLAAKSSQSPPLSLQPKSSEDSPKSKNQSGDALPHSKARDPIYFEFSRPELLALVPATARKVLDIGCGAGRLGADIKTRQAAEVHGIEYEAEPARRAAQRLDRVLTGDVETLEPDFLSPFPK